MTSEMDNSVNISPERDKDKILLDDMITADDRTSAIFSSIKSRKSIPKNEDEARIYLNDDVTNFLNDKVDHPLPISSSWSTLDSEFDAGSQLSLSECKTFRHENSMKAMAVNECSSRDETIPNLMPQEETLGLDSFVMLTSDIKDDNISPIDEIDNNSIPSVVSSESDTFSMISIPENVEDATLFHKNDVVQVSNITMECYDAYMPPALPYTVQSESNTDSSLLYDNEVVITSESKEVSTMSGTNPSSTHDNEVVITSLSNEISTISSKDDTCDNGMASVASSIANSESDTNASSMISLLERGEVSTKLHKNDIVLRSKMEDTIVSSMTDNDFMQTPSATRESGSCTAPLWDSQITSGINDLITFSKDEVVKSGSKPMPFTTRDSGSCTGPLWDSQLMSGSKDLIAFSKDEVSESNDLITFSKDEYSQTNCSPSVASTIVNSEIDINASSLLSLLERGEVVPKTDENDLVIVSKSDDPMYASLTVDSVFLTTKEDKVDEETKETDRLEYEYEMPESVQSTPIWHNDNCDPAPSDESSNVFNNNHTSSLSVDVIGNQPVIEDGIEVEIFYNIEKRDFMSSIRKGAVTVAGGALIGVGIPLIPTPVPGALFIASGLSLLGTEYPEAQDFLDKSRVSLSEYADDLENEDNERDLLETIPSDISTDSDIELNFMCGVIVPSRTEVDQVMTRAVDDAKWVGRKMNGSLKYFVKGAVLPIVNVITRKPEEKDEEKDDDYVCM